MLNQLREAERHKLAELQKKLEELQNQIANLIRRQSGHNLDNVALQGPEKLAKLDAKLIADLMSQAEREQGHLPPVPAIAQLSVRRNRPSGMRTTSARMRMQLRMVPSRLRI